MWLHTLLPQAKTFPCNDKKPKGQFGPKINLCWEYKGQLGQFGILWTCKLCQEAEKWKSIDIWGTCTLVWSNMMGQPPSILGPVGHTETYWGSN